MGMTEAEDAVESAQEEVYKLAVSIVAERERERDSESNWKGNKEAEMLSAFADAVSNLTLARLQASLERSR